MSIYESIAAQKWHKSRILAAFTLAEILIVLGIIGIVAEMTIPDLMISFQKQIYLTSFKKVYSTLNEALELMTTDNNCPGDLDCTGIFGSGTDSETAGKEFVKYFKLAKDCGTSDTEKCWSDETNQNFDGSGGSGSYNGWGYYNFITADGMSFCLINNPTYAAGFLGHIFVDTNGPKPPNCFGKDVFWFAIHGKNSLLIPAGSKDSFYWWNLNDADWCSKDNPDGGYCAGRIIEKGFVMDYLD